MNKKALSLAITLAMAFPTVSNALSLGDIESNSSLNQPFRGKINLLSTSAAEAKNLKVRVASQAVFNRVGIDRPAFLNSIRFRTTIQNGRPVILVSSSQPINEPFLNFLLEVNWANGQLLKEYTVLLDPPVLLRPDTAIASNNAGVRAEPRAQGRIVRPAAQQQTQQQRVAQQRRQAQAQRQAQQQRRVQQQRQAQQQARRAPQTAEQKFMSDARRVLAQQTQQRARSVAAVTTNTGKGYRVRRGDTLSKVAKRLGYRSVRSEQMMMALFEKNRGAFNRNNINNLKSGALIKRPSLQEAKSITIKQSRAQIAAQAREWKNSRGQAVASTRKSSNTQVASNSSNSRQFEVAGTGSSKGGASGSAALAALNEKLTLTNESLTTKQKENEELKSRVTELESLLRKKNRLITLKSEQLAKIQSGVAGEVEAPAVAEAEPVITEAPAPVSDAVEGNDIQTQVANDLANENGEIIRNGDAQAEAPSSDEEIAQMLAESDTPEGEELAVEEESAFVETAEASDSGIMSMLTSPAVLGGAAGLLGLGGLFWFMRRRKDDDFESFDSIDIDNQMDADSLDSSMIDESEFVSHDEVQQEITETGSDNHSDNADADEDILQEADVYIVYGLHDQAESELKQAIEKEPNNMAYRAKLLENYKASGDAEAFEAEAKVFMSIDSPDKDKYLEEITTWGNSLNPDSKLFSGEGLLGAAAGAGVAMVAGTALADNAEDTSDAVTDSLEDGLEDFNLDDVLSDDSDVVADLNMDLGADEGLIDIDDNIAIDIKSEDDGLLDIDDMELDTDFTGGGQFEEIVSGGTDMEDSVEDLLESNSIDLPEGLDMNFDEELDISADLDDATDALAIDSDMDAANLSLDIGAEDFDKLIPEDNAYKSDSKATTETEEVKSATEDSSEDNLLADFDDNLSFLDLDDDADVIEETQIETKLDLAKAYMDMGDIEGARSTLEEVMQEGSEDQKREAEELLHKAG